MMAVLVVGVLGAAYLAYLFQQHSVGRFKPPSGPE
jgi:hypothetical protein